MEAIIVIVVHGLIFGLASRYIAKEKGKKENIWFLLGFFLGLIGLIVVALSKDEGDKKERINISYYQQLTELHKLKENGIITEEDFEHKKEEILNNDILLSDNGYKKKKTSHTTGVLCYLLWWISGLFILIVEREDKLVRFHALQSIIFFGFINLLLFAPNIIFTFYSGPFYYGEYIFIIVGFIFFIAIIFWLILMVDAAKGGKLKIPIVGNIAERFA